MKTLYLAGGCFWCIADVFLHLKGVNDVVSGYAGGTVVNPSYEEVKSQKTGHREAIKIIYDENVVSINELLEVYYQNVDPFNKDGQFIDKGFSYTLCIYYQSSEDGEIITNFIKDKKSLTDKEIYIDVLPLTTFYLAEEYHQKYSLKNPEAFNEEIKISGRKK